MWEARSARMPFRLSRTDERPLVGRTDRDGNEIVDEIAPEPHDKWVQMRQLNRV
jgi:hypothetical protein